MINLSAWQEIDERLFLITPNNTYQNQEKTNDAFSEKWSSYSKEKIDEQEKLFEFQKKWFLNLYGFKDEKELAKYLQKCSFILDAGCGIGYKSSWFASLSPNSNVIGIDYSSSVNVAHQKYAQKHQNLIFAQGDIADTKLDSSIIDFTVCDQVIMHTENPRTTLRELSRITTDFGKVCCYWYKKKALPRELLDDYFRNNVVNLNNDDLWKLSEEVLKLGKMLSEMKVTANFPSVPSLGIEGGEMDLQRFIYWNFLKCFWNKELGFATSLSTN